MPALSQFFRPALLVLLAFSPCWSHAAVIERDWLSPGDGLLTYDDVNQREWLDLPYLIDEFHVISRDPEKRLELVLPELEPGGSLEGFVMANSADVIELAISAGIDVSTSSFAENELPTLALIDLVGSTSATTTGMSSIGLLNEFDSTTGRPVRLVSAITLGLASDTAGVGFIPVSELSSDIPTLITSVMLYRNVPEPSGLALTILASASFAVAQGRLP
ncbi:hypothetical protein NG895_05685 [Aeoliella sp. ICT_H6.2]|uniref:PEP-CTERM protein-sorting domain-containing protein n=1 Tax=Aeoliella straminimaris TaxID=2954799 RepID=A0A9X2JFK1_9BACT|nr:hypothetical protein [Aeoliella straminimaris]MCO6043392.1 hypothetical protein [Aeoliella straminimaris]